MTDFGAILRDEKVMARIRAGIASPNEKGCTLWIRNKNQSGYGIIKFDRKGVLVHRIMAASEYGYPTPERPCALHSCDVRSCVNPMHLRWGSHHENINDMMERSRQVEADGSRQGEGNPFRKLDDDAVRIIRRGGKTNQNFADHFGVSTALISAVKNHLAWRHVS